MENYHRWKADLTGALLIGNVYDIFCTSLPLIFHAASVLQITTVSYLLALASSVATS